MKVSAPTPRKMQLCSYVALKPTGYEVFHYWSIVNLGFCSILTSLQNFHITTILSTLDQTLSCTSVPPTWLTRIPTSISRRSSKCLLLFTRLTPSAGGFRAVGGFLLTEVFLFWPALGNVSLRICACCLMPLVSRCSQFPKMLFRKTVEMKRKKILRNAFQVGTCLWHSCIALLGSVQLWASGCQSWTGSVSWRTVQALNWITL